MNKPSYDEIDAAVAVLRWALRDLETNEPYATNDISGLESAISTLECIEEDNV